MSIAQESNVRAFINSKNRLEIDGINIEILGDKERKWLVNKGFDGSFVPRYLRQQRVYEINLEAADLEAMHSIVQQIFASLMQDDDEIFVYSWQHTAFAYNPQIPNKVLDTDYEATDAEWDELDTQIGNLGGEWSHFESFYDFFPDGDDCQFTCYNKRLDKWRFIWLVMPYFLNESGKDEIIIYGDTLIKEVEKYEKLFGLTRMEDSSPKRKFWFW